MRSLIAFALIGLAAPAAAQLPEGACYAMQPSAADPTPARGVQALYVRFSALTDMDASNKGPWRHLRIIAQMGSQGQAARDGVEGATLTQVAQCRTEQQGECWALDNRSHLTLDVRDGQTLMLLTRDFVVADYGESLMASNLAETIGRESRYTLTRLNNGRCPVE